MKKYTNQPFVDQERSIMSVRKVKVSLVDYTPLRLSIYFEQFDHQGNTVKVVVDNPDGTRDSHSLVLGSTYVFEIPQS